jgi:hypothetical protein
MSQQDASASDLHVPGDPAELDACFPVVYDELRRLAGRYLRAEDVGQTLQPTALVHEAYLRLVGQRHVAWRNRAQLLGIARRGRRRGGRRGRVASCGV